MMDLLDLAQHENSNFKLNTEPFSLLKTIRNSFQVVSHVAELKGVSLVEPKLQKQEAAFFTQVEGDSNRY